MADAKPIYQAPFFEGAEKKVEIRFHVEAGDPRGMRDLPVGAWSAALGRGGVEIISSIHGRDWDAYVLSESSLFVSRTRIVCKTCGQSAPLFVLEDVMQLCGTVGCHVRTVIFSRSNLLDHTQQQPVHRSFASERKFLDDLLQVTGAFYVFGDVSGAHWNIYTATVPAASGTDPVKDEAYPATLEMAMYGLDQAVATSKWWKHNTEDAIACRVKSGLAAMLPGPDVQWDDYIFNPCGYSMNAIDEEGAYYTVHVTPQDGCSFASFETSATGSRCALFIETALSIFKPTDVSISLLNAEDSAQIGASELPILHNRCGFAMDSDCKQNLSNNFGRGSHHFRSYNSLGASSVIKPDGATAGNRFDHVNQATRAMKNSYSSMTVGPGVMMKGAKGTSTTSRL